MADTLTPEKWGRKESADWWSAGQAARQQIYGGATEMMLDLAGVQAGSRVLDVAAGTGESALMAAARVGPKGHVVAADVSASHAKRCRGGGAQGGPDECRDSRYERREP